ncbi:MAG TPA: 6-bladed beta-propeller [Gemmatimonadaceae bacterium]|nr:6-bladed beta-propeller [Gemmatimonadaceae bacterium]
MNAIHIRRLCVVLCMLAVCACGDSGSRSGGAVTTVIDTAGDTLVARTRGTVAAGAMHRLIIDWRAGAADEKNDFANIGEIAVSSDGRVYVWDPETPSLRYYDASGTLVKNIARKGSGPGEYTSLNGLAVLPDGRVVAWDMDGRINVYSADGVPAKTLRSPMIGYGTNGALATDAASRLWVTGFVRTNDQSWGVLGRGAWFVVDTMGAVLDTVLQPTTERGDEPLIAKIPGGMSSYSLPFGRKQVFAVSAVGALIWGPSDPYRLYATYNGRPLRIEREWSAVRVADEERAERRASVEWGLRRADPAWTWQAKDVPKTKPAYTRINVGGDGRIWVTLSVESVPYQPDAPAAKTQPPRPQIHFRDGADWRDVFEADGRYLGRVVIPPRVELFAMRGDAVWGVMTDQDDVPSLVKMRVVPGFGR